MIVEPSSRTPSAARNREESISWGRVVVSQGQSASRFLSIGGGCVASQCGSRSESLTTASAAGAAGMSLIVGTLCMLNYRGSTLRLARFIDRYLLIGGLRRAMSLHNHRPTFWVLRSLGLWSVIGSVSSLAALAAR